jgi:hypothetical protein
MIANKDRLYAYMDRLGLEAVAVRSGVNFTYLARMAMPARWRAISTLRRPCVASC